MTFRKHWSALVAFAAMAGFATSAQATTVLAQKGNGCSATWNTGQATAIPNRNLKKPWSLTCTDGDPTCDVDGTKNNECQIQVAACTLQTSPLCLAGPEQLTKLKLNGPARRAGIGTPAFAPQNCGAPGIVRLRLRNKGRKPSNRTSLVLNFKTTPSGSGKNVVQLQCIPNPGTGEPPPTGCVAKCPNNPSIVGSPKQMCLTVPLVNQTTGSNGSDLDTGYSGASHNFPIPAAASLRYCLSNCDGISDNQCDLSGDTGSGSLNGPTFGAPLPLLSSNLPVCVVNKFQPGAITGTFDLAAGTGGPNPVNLFSETYLRVGFPDVCPRCVVQGVNDASAIGKTGTCSQTSSAPGAQCTVDGFVKVAGVSGDPNYTLSSSCPPQGSPVGTLNIPLRLTTGTAESGPGPLPCSAPPVNQTIADSCGGGSCTATCTNCLPTSPPGQCIDPKGGIAQACCSNDSSKSCFPTKVGNGVIMRQGQPGTTSAVFASTFCIASTGSSSIDAVAGLPGPGALLLPADIQVLKHVP